MKGWMVWAAVVALLVLAVVYSSAWEIDFGYWVTMQVRSLARMIHLF